MLLFSPMLILVVIIVTVLVFIDLFFVLIMFTNRQVRIQFEGKKNECDALERKKFSFCHPHSHCQSPATAAARSRADGTIVGQGIAIAFMRYIYHAHFSLSLLRPSVLIHAHFRCRQSHPTRHSYSHPLLNSRHSFSCSAFPFSSS